MMYVLTFNFKNANHVQKKINVMSSEGQGY